MKIQVVCPTGHLGCSASDSAVDTAIRAIAWANSTDEQRRDDSVDKYGHGLDIENDTFLMHPFCWCERDDCPWCCGCECPSSAFRYYVDGKEVGYDRFRGFFDEMTAPFYDPSYSDPVRHAKWNKAAAEANRRRKSTHDGVCPYCTGSGIFARFAVSGKPFHRKNYYNPPNFWYKPTDYRVTWYKYIGRDMQANRNTSLDELREIARACMPGDWALEAAMLAVCEEGRKADIQFRAILASASGKAKRKGKG